MMEAFFVPKLHIKKNTLQNSMKSGVNDYHTMRLKICNTICFKKWITLSRVQTKFCIMLILFTKKDIMK